MAEYTVDLGLPSTPPDVGDPTLNAQLEFIYNALTAIAIQMDRMVSLSEGLYLKDTQAPPHYWRVNVNNLGVLVTTDTGTTPPL